MLAAAAAVIVTAAGRIGPLRMGRSTRTDIVGFAGRPDAERRDREPGGPAYRALGYDCKRTFAEPLFRVSSRGPYCRTVFFVNMRTGRLGDAYLSSARYVEAHGVRIGMTTAAAERRLHKLAFGGCTDVIRFGFSMTIPIAGGTYRRLRSGALHVVGGHVRAFVLHSPHDAVGVFDCW